MNTVIMIAGYVFLGLLVLAVLWSVWSFCFEVGEIGQGSGYIVRAFGFGVIHAKADTMLNRNCNHVRKTQGKEWFITAPEWFNRYVANVGGCKK